MGLLAILASFLQLCFSLIKVFRSLKQGVRQIDYIQWYTNTFPDPFQEKPLIISYRKIMAIGGQSQERGGQLQPPQEAPRAALRQPSNGCQSRAGGTCLQYIVLLNPKGLTSSRIRLLPIYLVPQSCLYSPLSTKSLHNYLL